MTTTSTIDAFVRKNTVIRNLDKIHVATVRVDSNTFKVYAVKRTFGFDSEPNFGAFRGQHYWTSVIETGFSSNDGEKRAMGFNPRKFFGGHRGGADSTLEAQDLANRNACIDLIHQDVDNINKENKFLFLCQNG